MRLHRFYVSQPLGEDVVIDDVSLVNQWTKVFRYTSGDFVTLFNGDGFDYQYSLRDVTKKTCSLTMVKKDVAYIPKRQSFLFISLIKKDNFELVVQKATECGVTDVVPLITSRTEKKNLDARRLATIIQEASEQSGRGDLLRLHTNSTLNEAFTLLEKESILPKHIYVTTLFGTPVDFTMQDPTSSPIAFFVGPEGGWSDNEEELFKNTDYSKISLGKTVLRAETAGITCAILSSLL